MEDSLVHIWQEKVIIPTYPVGAPDKNPMFFEKRVYQGSSGVVYPNPVIEKIYDEKTDKEYIGLFLENAYLKIMILPELGGRVQLAYDKIGQRHFIYYNQVIKPALVGLCGPWISGGIEFNWPQHHRPSTFAPVDYSIQENSDGSRTVWINEVETMTHTKGMAGFTLHPGKAYLEIRAKLYNRTPLPQTFLWWANPAVKVNDDYQSIFPPDVHAVFDHGKRDVSSFPIATGTYYKVDYSPGTDISRYKNIPVPTSYMAIHSDYDFMGGYEHDTKAGVLHIADHHISPGKKQWTWGHSDFGQAWDRNLTDEDGPYIELMAGVYTDNQPDFTWLMPYEEKSFVQYFLPYRELGRVTNANKDILVSMEKAGDKLTIKVFATSEQKGITLRLLRDNELIDEVCFDVSPENIFDRALPVPPDIAVESIRWQIVNAAGKMILRYEQAKNSSNDYPEPAKAPLSPEAIENNEQLFLTGRHLEQYRHATYSPLPYYEEALRRDAGDARNNNALGLWYLRRGQFERSEPYFRKALETLTRRNPNPYDGEPYYNLGLSLKAQCRLEEAYGAFYKACWNSAWQDSAYFSLAQLDAEKGDWERSLEHIGRSLDKNTRNARGWALKAIVLRKAGQYGQAERVCAAGLEQDEFNLPLYFEQYKNLQAAGGASVPLARLKRLARGAVQNYIAYALDYSAAGLYKDAIEFLSLYTDADGSAGYPMAWYYLGWWHHLAGDEAASVACLQKGAGADTAFCFPNRLEDIAVLRFATAKNSADWAAPYYLGNLWYDKRQYEPAIEQWELSAARNPSFPTVARNLGIAWFNKKGDTEKALRLYKMAFALDSTDARVLMELDQLSRRLNKDPRERLEFLEQHLSLVEMRDDLYLERAALYNFLDQYDTAFELIRQRQFHPWEGGEGKVSAQYVYSLQEMAKQNIRAGHFQKSINLLEQAEIYPHNLGEGKLSGTTDNELNYWLGIAFERLSDTAAAESCFKKATEGQAEPAVALFYNDQQPDKIFYQGLAWKKLGNPQKALRIFTGLLEYSNTHLDDEIQIDYFAVSLPDLLIFEDDGKSRHQAHCHYMMGLAHLGSGRKEEAAVCLKKVLARDNMHFGARTHLSMIEQWKEQEVLNTKR
jgi:tetratricopeptide (TPR) repeat protein